MVHKKYIIKFLRVYLVCVVVISFGCSIFSHSASARLTSDSALINTPNDRSHDRLGLVQKNHGSLGMIHGTCQPFHDHCMTMGSFPWLIMFQDKHLMRLSELLKVCHQNLGFCYFGKKNFRTLWCLHTEVISPKKNI